MGILPLPPAIIDLSPYWRPAEFATAIFVVDGIVWDSEPDSVMDILDNTYEMNQLLVRAEIRRITELDGAYKQFGKQCLDEVEAHSHVIDLIIARINSYF